MKSNELRTGNLLNYDTAEGETLPTKIDWQDLKWLSEDEKGFNLVHSPIPITEEWLLKFGFVSNPYKDTYEKMYVVINCNKTSGELELYLDALPIDIYHVHQLQNLYFALTGEELTII
jgi:hypothetical protein